MLLVYASLLLVFLTWMPYGFSLPGFLQAAVADPKVIAQVSKLIGDPAAQMSAAELVEPGLYLKSPIDQISLGLALVFGTAGMPHILMRFFTVPTAKDARVIVLWAMAIIGGFYVLTLFLGLGAAINVGAAKISAVDAGGNMAGPLVAAAQLKLADIDAELTRTTDAAVRSKFELERTAARAASTAAQAKIDQVRGQTRSFVGLTAPLISLKNPGIFSIPIGFLLVVLGSLMTREKRAEDLWEEFYVRQNTGLHAEGASGH